MNEKGDNIVENVIIENAILMLVAFFGGFVWGGIFWN